MQGNTSLGVEGVIVKGDRRVVKGLASWQLHSFVFLQHTVSAMVILIHKKQTATITSSSQGKTC